MGNQFYLSYNVFMIGPHEGRELSLMLAGKKRLAVFCDYLPETGVINEKIIPETAFSLYVKSAEITRLERDIQSNNDTVRYVCFTLPSEAWRAEAYLFLREKIHGRQIQHTSSLDEIFGHLLDYDQGDIDAFIQT